VSIFRVIIFSAVAGAAVGTILAGRVVNPRDAKGGSVVSPATSALPGSFLGDVAGCRGVAPCPPYEALGQPSGGRHVAKGASHGTEAEMGSQVQAHERSNANQPAALQDATAGAVRTMGNLRRAERRRSCQMVEFFSALRQVESGGDDRAVGDGNTSHGPYQIGLAYWLDGSGTRQAWPCYDRAKCEAVMMRYWQRYCPQALLDSDFEVLARVHNGGPGGASKVATLAYWQKVQEAMR